MPFIDLLVKGGHIQEADAQRLFQQSQTDSSVSLDTLLKNGGVQSGDIVKARSEFSGVPAATTQGREITYDILKHIPEENARHYRSVPIGLSNGILEVGMVDPDNIEARDALQFIANKVRMPFRVYVIPEDEFTEVVESYGGLSGEVSRALSEINQDDLAPVKEEEKIEIGAHENEDEAPEHVLEEESGAQITEDAPVTKIVSVMLRHAVDGNASDIHIEHLGDRVRVRFRVDGDLYTSLFLPKNVHSAVVARIKILTNLKLDERRKPQDGRFSVHVDSRRVDFRVSTFPAHFGEKVVLRILDSEKGIRKLEELGLSVRNLAIVKTSIKVPHGIILITGPTGSGKSTTLYSMLNAVDKERKNVISLEDPVEYNMPGISQSQVRPEIGYTFASGLRSILRQDPDIIMVGEIRDKETAQLAIQAALTGHLVFATLHTNSAVGAIPRLIDMGVDPYLIAPTLVAAIGQRLARVLCPSSAKKLDRTESLKAMVDKQFADLPEEFRTKLPLDKTFYEAVPSGECPSGTRGRAAVLEILEVNKGVERMILENPTEQAIWAEARKNGMLTMKEDAILKAFEGVIPFAEINKV